MKIVVEEKVAGLYGRLEAMGHQVVYLPALQIDAGTVKDADALVVRTRTRCDASLLDGSAVKLVCSATAGTDHIDIPWCNEHGIRIVAAPGCNAPAVNQYVWQAIKEWRVESGEWRANHQTTPLSTLHTPLSIGIIGVGHVGSLVEKEAHRRGWNVILNDPPRAESEGAEGFSSLEEIASNSDIVTVHTPLDATTIGLIDDKFLSMMRPHALLINAARGGIVDEDALLSRGIDCVIDCWEGEPDINRKLMAHALIATPHIAGYSIESKRRAADAVVAAVTGQPDPNTNQKYSSPIAFDLKAMSDEYKAHPADMERLRNTWPLRRETSI